METLSESLVVIGVESGEGKEGERESKEKGARRIPTVPSLDVVPPCPQGHQRMRGGGR